MITLLTIALALAQEPADEAFSGVVSPGDLPALRVEPAPVAGVESTITLIDDLDRGDPGATVQVVYRPGLSGERQRAIGITDSRGRVRWVPEIAGRAVVRAGDDVLPVAIGWAGPPAATLTLLGLLAVAAATLVGYGALPRRTPRRLEDA